MQANHLASFDDGLNPILIAKGVFCQPADLNFDGSINVTDLLLLIDMWGGTGSADIDSNGVVDVSDLLILIGSWS